MDYLSYNVAVNLKQIRLSKGMSLGEVAEQTGVSKSMLAQIEKGTANPSLGVLGKITSGLRIEFQTLIDAPREDFCLVSPKEIFPTKELEGPYEDSHSVEVYRIDIEPGGVYMSGSHGEKTREYITVTEGVLTIECHGHTQIINKEQVYKFETDQMHVYRNEGRETVSFTCFFLDYTGLR